MLIPFLYSAFHRLFVLDSSQKHMIGDGMEQRSLNSWRFAAYRSTTSEIKKYVAQK